MVATGVLTVIFGSHETSDFWVDGLKVWWGSVKDRVGSIRRLVLYLDNGPNNSGTRTQFLKRMVDFADMSGLKIRLVYYPPYHSKYNGIERYWAGLEKSWNGYLLSTVKDVLNRAANFFWKGAHASVRMFEGVYEKGIRVCGKDKAKLEPRLVRSEKLPLYDITIWPQTVYQ